MTKWELAKLIATTTNARWRFKMTKWELAKLMGLRLEDVDNFSDYYTAFVFDGEGYRLMVAKLRAESRDEAETMAAELYFERIHKQLFGG